MKDLNETYSNNTFQSQSPSNLKMVYEYFVFIIGPLTAIIAAVVSIKAGVRVWIRYEFFLELLVGSILIIRPQLFLSIILDTPIDKYHIFLSTFFGGYLFSTTIYPFLLRNSKDQGVLYGYFWSRILLSSLIITENLFTYSYGNSWNYKLLIVSSLGFAVLFFVNTYYLIQTRKPACLYEGHINLVINLEFFLMFGSGILYYAFPEQIIPVLIKTDTLPHPSYVSILRSVGGVLLGFSVQSLFAPYFRFHNDKRLFILSRLFASLIELTCWFTGLLFFDIFSGLGAMRLALTCNVIYNAVSLYGYFFASGSGPKVSTAIREASEIAEFQKQSD